MRLVGRRREWKAIFLAAIVAGTSGCSGGAAGTHDGGPWCDGGCPPPAAPVAWDRAVFSAPHDQLNICGAVVLPTGIAILAPPKYILLADKTDGHLLAQAAWPTSGNDYPSYCRSAVVRSSGNLAILTDDYPTSSSEEMAVHEFRGADLAAVKTTVLSKSTGLSVIGELDGEIHVLSHAGTSVDTLYLYSIPDGGSVQTQVLATGDGAPSVHDGSFAASAGSGLLSCGTYFKSGPPAVLRIDPPKTMTKTLSFDGGTGSEDCRLTEGAGRDLVTWEKGYANHWDIVSSDGTQLIASGNGPNPNQFSIAYGEGAFASVICSDNQRIDLYVTDPATAAVRGPYDVPVRYPVIGKPAIAGAGDSLWVAYDEYEVGSIYLIKLGPLPPK